MRATATARRCCPTAWSRRPEVRAHCPWGRPSSRSTRRRTQTSPRSSGQSPPVHTIVSCSLASRASRQVCRAPAPQPKEYPPRSPAPARSAGSGRGRRCSRTADALRVGGERAVADRTAGAGIRPDRCPARRRPGGSRHPAAVGLDGGSRGADRALVVQQRLALSGKRQRDAPRSLGSAEAQPDRGDGAGRGSSQFAGAENLITRQASGASRFAAALVNGEVRPRSCQAASTTRSRGVVHRQLEGPPGHGGVEHLHDGPQHHRGERSSLLPASPR